MSRRNSRFQKEIRKEQRAQDRERAAFIHEASKELPVLQGKEVRYKNRKERRG